MARPRLAAGTSLTALAVDEDLAAGDLLEPGDHPQQRGLSAAGRADEDDELAVLDVEVDAVDDLDRAEALDDAAELEARHHATSLRRFGQPAGVERMVAADRQLHRRRRCAPNDRRRSEARARGAHRRSRPAAAPPSVSALCRRRNWPALRSGAGGDLRDRRVDRLLPLRVGGDEAPGRRAGIVGAAVALRRQPLEAEAQARHVLLRAERDRERGEASRRPFRAPRRRNPPSRSGSRASPCAQRRCATGPRT